MIHFIYHFIVDMNLIRNSEGAPSSTQYPSVVEFIKGRRGICEGTLFYCLNKKMLEPGILGESKAGAVVRALAFHQCVPGSIPGFYAIRGLSLLVLYSAPRGFS